jgi:hypothetical protein
MAMSAYERGVQLQEVEVQMLEKRPEYRKKMRVLNIITAVMMGGGLVWLGVAASGELRKLNDAPPVIPMLLQMLVFVAVVNMVMAFVFTKIMARPTEHATTFTEAVGRATTAQIVTLAFGEAICIYGIVTQFLGGPDAAVFGLIILGFVTMLATTAVLKPKIKTALLRHLKLE